ncbi:MAG: OsmC family protein [Pseudomonadota bacterium]|nr:OsmC family protein [Pseudomonadota bacterium]
MKFRIDSAGGVASHVRIGEHELRFDQPPSFGGGDTGPSPLDVMVATVGACAHYYAAAFLQARKLPVDRLSVVVEAEKTTAGAHRIKRLSVVVVLPPGLPEELLPRVERAVRGCPAWGTLVDAPELSMTVIPFGAE